MCIASDVELENCLRLMLKDFAKEMERSQSFRLGVKLAIMNLALKQNLNGIGRTNE